MAEDNNDKGKKPDEKNKGGDTGASGDASGDKGQGGSSSGDATKSFSQDDVNSILAKERRKFEDKAKADADAAKEAAEKAVLEESNEYKKLYEAEQLKLSKTQADLAAQTLSNLRMKVATAVGLPSTMVDRLVGNTEEEIMEDAKALMKVVRPTDDEGDEGKPAGTPSGTGSSGSTTKKPKPEGEQKKIDLIKQQMLGLNPTPSL